MKGIRKAVLAGLKPFFGIFLFLISAQLMGSDKNLEVITEIILINRQAELVEMDEDGEILKRHLAIPDYFTSGKSHRRSLRESLRQIRDYGQVEESHILPGSSDLPASCLQSFMLSHLVKKELDPLMCYLEFSYDEKHGLNLSLLLLPDNIKGDGTVRKELVKNIKKAKPYQSITSNLKMFCVQEAPNRNKQRIYRAKRLRLGGYNHLT